MMLSHLDGVTRHYFIMLSLSIMKIRPGIISLMLESVSEKALPMHWLLRYLIYYDVYYE